MLGATLVALPEEADSDLCGARVSHTPRAGASVPACALTASDLVICLGLGFPVYEMAIIMGTPPRTI